MRMVALLRGINVGGNRKVPMAALCALAAEAGLSEVRHYINSGNLVFDAGGMKADRVAVLLEREIAGRFGFHVDVVVRTASQWKAYAKGSPFPGAERSRPEFLQLGLSRLPCDEDLEKTLGARATRGERVRLAGGAIWVDFAAGVGRSRLTPALFDKAAGSPVTMRNWNTVLRLDEMLSGGA
jgi:uncharacterized protein (DUF1697 family)